MGEYTVNAELDVPYKLIQDAVAKQLDRIKKLQASGNGGEDLFKLRATMQDTLMEKVGIFRNGKDLDEAVEILRDLYARSANIGLKTGGQGARPELTAALRLPGMLRLALCIAYGATQRTESRGSHFREDYPKRDDANWLKRTLATWEEGKDLPTLNYEDVTITELPPGDRGYGEATQVKAQ